jgi:hypothetical protein
MSKSDNNQSIKNKCDCKERKTATDNQWVSTGLRNYPDQRDRRNGPGGENKATSNISEKKSTE